MDTQDFIQHIMQGNAVEARETLNSVLSTKAFEAIQERKVDLAQNIFASADDYAEEFAEEVEQIDELTGKGQLPNIKKYHTDAAEKSTKKYEGLRSSPEQNARTKRQGEKAVTSGFFANYYSALHHKNQAKRAGALMKKLKMKEEVELDEGIDTHIKLGKKVKNSDGGHDQTVHYKGKKIGHIGSYEHPSGTKYYAVHHASESDITGSRSAKEALGDLRSLHADHLRPRD